MVWRADSQGQVNTLAYSSQHYSTHLLTCPTECANVRQFPPLTRIGGTRLAGTVDQMMEGLTTNGCAVD